MPYQERQQESGMGTGMWMGVGTHTYIAGNASTVNKHSVTILIGT